MTPFRNFTLLGTSLITDEGGVLINVHTVDKCVGRNCVIHRPSKHHMRGWPLYYRPDRTLFERMCDHGCGHPDPDQFAYWTLTQQSFKRDHGCCGCCIPEEGV